MNGTSAIATAEMLAEVAEGLGRAQKELSPKYFYDACGSALFDRITELPEYYLTRVERRLLETFGVGWIRSIRPAALIELGAGSADKTRILLDALARDAAVPAAHRGAAARAWYVPIDISPSYLTDLKTALDREYPSIEVHPVEADMTAHVALPADLPRPLVFAFLGSTIGNFDHDQAIALLRRVSAALRPGDHFLMGADLVKDAAILESAYDDAAGVTAAFNLNVLDVLNRELDANFDAAAFSHRAFYDRALRRIEMHLVSRTDQDVRIGGAGEFHFEAGETIRTEISCKYDRAAVEELFDAAGLIVERWVTDEQARYALVVGIPERHD